MNTFNDARSYDDHDFEGSDLLSPPPAYDGAATAVKEEGKPDIIKVSTQSRAPAVAGAIAAVVRIYGYAEVQAIGAGAVNQAVKALAIARGYLKTDGYDIVCAPYFTDVDIQGQARTAVRFYVEKKL